MKIDLSRLSSLRITAAGKAKVSIEPQGAPS